MKAVLQRVTRASVAVDGAIAGHIDDGLLILVCVVPTDTKELAGQLASKIANLRILEDDEGKMNRSLLDLPADRPRALVVSQFTLAADARKGRRPSFAGAARPDQAVPLLEVFCATLNECGIATETGIFGAHMEVSLVNDGPVTIWLDTDELYGASTRKGDE
ncbi:MAG: D-tyrosyl-tRNA(Tyr) deacylase [Thermomicrobiales bacterium]|nr:D-tyrosyl-tRNA(Tyr) deacylase [Thermomicrobiales bacterium]MCO5222420.1 D-aminoacyl-tRNA deacylase [Thermomicrobiales bacterium]